MSYASLGKTYLITPLRKEAPIHIVSCDDMKVIRVRAPKKIRPTDDAWIVQAAGHERRRDCSFRGGNIRIFATVDV